jgi:xyloglucan-specific exo-beta-1,4-glucanase
MRVPWLCLCGPVGLMGDFWRISPWLARSNIIQIGVMRIKQSLCGAVAAVVLACAGAQTAGAADVPYAFRNVVIGGGGYVPAIVFSRVAKRLAYLRTDIGGAYRWDEDTARWVPLLDGMPLPAQQGVESILPDPVQPDRVYAALGMYAHQGASIARSDDRGRTWRVVPVPFAMGGNEDGRGMGERLAIDPQDNRNVLFGSRHDGLWHSVDAGNTWTKLSAFPYAGAGKPPQYQTHGGIGFVLFDHRVGSRLVAAAVSDPGRGQIYLSHDGGGTWAAAPAGPAGMVPTRGDFGPDGTLYVAFDDWIGPNGIHKGAVWSLSPAGVWRDITPDATGEGGYMGIAVDPTRSGVLLVATLDRWHPGDTIFRSTDGGAHWEDLAHRSGRDVAYSPWLDFVGGSEHFGHWMSALAIDPFQPAHVAYATGATIFAADSVMDTGQPVWHVWTQGVEENAVLALSSPTGGAPLLSALGDIGGFAHDQLNASPPQPFTNPFLPNTNTIDYAGLAPHFVVRSGTARTPDPATVATLAISEDGGHTWRPIRLPALSPAPGQKGERFDVSGDASIVISADGQALVSNTPVPLVSHDGGRNWQPCAGLPPQSRVMADKGLAGRFYAVDFVSGLVLASSDGGVSFAPVPARGLPAKLDGLKPWNREAPFNLLSTPGRAGELWMLVKGDLYVSRDGGQSFRSFSRKLLWVNTFGLGKPAPGSRWPMIFAAGGGELGDGLYRSADGGATWARISDPAHQWGHAYSPIAGDPCVLGRVYFGAGGRGIVVGEPARKP